MIPRNGNEYADRVRPPACTPRLRLHPAIAAIPLLLGCAGTAGPTLDPVAPGQQIRGGDGSYEIRIPNGHWARTPGGSITGEVAEVELVRVGGETWLFVSRSSHRSLRLEDVVSSRRDHVVAIGGIRSFRERRYFLSEGEVPASLARYEGDSHVFLVLSAVRGAIGIEIVSSTPLGPGGHEPELHRILDSLRFIDEGGT